MIYFIGSSEFKLVKIGFSLDTITLKSRINLLQTSSPFTIEVIKCYDGDRNLEKALHKKFKHLKVKNEWFKYEDEIVNFINSTNKLGLEVNNTNPFIVEKQLPSNNYPESNLTIYRNGEFLDKKLKLSEVALKLLIYITETLRYNDDVTILNTAKINNFLRRSNIKSRTTFYKAVKELCNENFIKEHSTLRCNYWINIHLFFSGDRTKYRNNLKVIN